MRITKFNNYINITRIFLFFTAIRTKQSNALNNRIFLSNYLDYLKVHEGFLVVTPSYHRHFLIIHISMITSSFKLFSRGRKNPGNAQDNRKFFSFRKFYNIISLYDCMFTIRHPYCHMLKPINSFGCLPIPHLYFSLHKYSFQVDPVHGFLHCP